MKAEIHLQKAAENSEDLKEMPEILEAQMLNNLL